MSLKVKFKIKSNHPSGKFSVEDNQILGNVTVDFREDFVNISSMEYGLKGNVKVVYNDVSSIYNVKLKKFQSYGRLVDEKIGLFNTTKQVPNYSKSGNSYNFKKGDLITIPIDIKFPSNEKYLPSSAEHLGTDTQFKGFLQVDYTIYLTIKLKKKKSKIFSKEDFLQFYHPVIYQSQANHSESGKSDNKIEKFEQTEIFQDKGIDLTVHLLIPKLLDFRCPIFSQLWFKFETGYNSSIPNGNKLPSFVNQGSSTGLGRFSFKSVEFFANYTCRYKVLGFSFRNILRVSLTKLINNRLTFDIKDFNFCPAKQKFILEMGGNELLDKTSWLSLMEFMNKSATFMPNCKLGNNFQNQCCLDIVIVIGDENEDKKYKFKTIISPSILNSGVLQFNKMDLKSVEDEQYETYESGEGPDSNSNNVIKIDSYTISSSRNMIRLPQPEEQIEPLPAYRINESSPPPAYENYITSTENSISSVNVNHFHEK